MGLYVWWRKKRGCWRTKGVDRRTRSLGNRPLAKIAGGRGRRCLLNESTVERMGLGLKRALDLERELDVC
jgi:hypothetical protein